jgi:hypothetical protein
VASKGERRGACRVLVGRPDGKRALVRTRRRWKDNITMDLQEVGWGYGMDLFGPEQGQVAGSFECCNEPSGSTKCREFFHKLRTG